MWAKIPDGLPEDPKVLKLGKDMAAACWLYVGGECYCARHLTDGMIPAEAVIRLTYLDDAPRLAERLVDVGLWERNTQGYTSVDYLERNPSKERYEAWRAAGSKASLASWERRRARQAKSEAPNEAESESLGDAETRPVPSRPSSPSFVLESEDLSAETLIEAFMERFPTENRLRVTSEIQLNAAPAEAGLENTAEAVRRTIQRANTDPIAYFLKALESVKAGN